MKNLIVILFSGFVLLTACNSVSKKSEEKVKPDNSSEIMTVATPKTIIYKTKNDYSNNVLVQLSDDKSKIVSYPAVSDVKNPESVKPIALVEGYLLDQRGISVNGAALSISYDEYSKLEKQPSAKELFDLIIDNDPFTEFHKLKKSFKNVDKVEAINTLINNGELK